MQSNEAFLSPRQVPERIVVKPEERRRLLNAAKELGSAIKGLVSIVKPATFMCWVNADKGPEGKKPTGEEARPPQDARRDPAVDRADREGDRLGIHQNHG